LGGGKKAQNGAEYHPTRRLARFPLERSRSSDKKSRQSKDWAHPYRKSLSTFAECALAATLPIKGRDSALGPISLKRNHGQVHLVQFS
jgi:hypothetical protein